MRVFTLIVTALVSALLPAVTGCGADRRSIRRRRPVKR
ncbi:hypothetical protein NG2371_03838 [Nocardia gamkensis]|nr:hypothetical protein [Nocardia gamkensis]